MSGAVSPFFEEKRSLEIRPRCEIIEISAGRRDFERSPVAPIFIGLTESMELSEFEEAIEKALNKVPKRFREILTREDIQVLAREKVPGVLRDRYRGRLLFGIFTGVPYNRRSMFNIQMEPTRIELYQDSFETAFNNRSEMEEQIAKTVIHEIGHYFGFSEKELRSRGL